MLDNKQFGRLVNKIIRLVFDIFDWFVHLVTWFTSAWTWKQQLPPIKSDLLHLSAKQLALRIRSREIRCEDLVETYINRIKDVQPIINSVVQDRFEEALKEAKDVDKFIAENHHVAGFAEDKPLLGVPFTVKESIAVKGLSNNAARSRVSSHVADKDADVVKALKNAGAIPLLVSNTPELCLYWETYNAKVGQTNNPYDSKRTAGGSSGGEVSLLGSGASVIGLGSDIAGSLRVPAFFCGVYGHKPTPGYVPNDGHIPASQDPMWDYYFTIGPVTRYAEDLPLLLKTMITEKSKIGKLRLDQSVDVSKVKILYMYGEGSDSLLQKVPGVECIRAVGLAISTLREKYGCQVEEVKLKEFNDSLYLNSLILQMKGIENVFQSNDDNPDDWGMLRVLQLILKKLTFQSSASISCILYGPLKALIDLTPENVRNQLKQRANSIQEKVVDLLKSDTVLLYPTFPQEAPLHNRMCSKILDVSYCTIFNVLGMPVTQCPITLTRDGLPVGLQIVAAPHEDRLCLAVARALEKELGGWVPPGSQEKA